MLGLNSPAVQIEVKHEGAGAERVDSTNADNLAKRLPLCVGCRVMLTRNLWGNVGVVNGVKGTVYDISWAEGADVLQDAPEVVMVVFNNYTGPAFASADGRELRDGARLLVPILRVRQDFTVRTHACYREQFPFLVCYANHGT
jgi:ATP-dependent DNA helicase PIF1